MLDTVTQCSDHSTPSQREIREAGEGNHSLYETLCSLVSLLFLALSPCRLLVPGNTAGKRLAHLQLLSLCTLPKDQSSMSVTSLNQTHTHTWLGAKQHQGHQRCVWLLDAWGVCVCVCAQWKKTLFVPFFLGYPLFLKVYSWYRLSGSNRVLAFFKQAVHLEKQSIDYTEEECLFTAVLFTGLCSLFLFRERSLSLLLCLFSNKLSFSKAKPASVIFTVWCICCLLKWLAGYGSWS